MPTVRIPVPLRRYAGDQARVEAQGDTAGAVLDDLTRQWPELGDFLFDDDGDFVTSTYESVNVLLGFEDVRELEGRATPVGSSDELMILRTWPAAISGGKQWNQPIGAEPPA